MSAHLDDLRAAFVAVAEGHLGQAQRILARLITTAEDEAAARRLPSGTLDLRAMRFRLRRASASLRVDGVSGPVALSSVLADLDAAIGDTSAHDGRQVRA